MFIQELQNTSIGFMESRILKKQNQLKRHHHPQYRHVHLDHVLESLKLQLVHLDHDLVSLKLQQVYNWFMKLFYYLLSQNI